mmetsp:Transcript_39016/g.117882  ORF Transcript_39016/g.117882 Transcript_39016/m.117882 type:complete len:202 (-) Transcript_39016:1497-2102(-)
MPTSGPPPPLRSSPPWSSGLGSRGIRSVTSSSTCCRCGCRTARRWRTGAATPRWTSSTSSQTPWTTCMASCWRASRGGARNFARTRRRRSLARTTRRPRLAASLGTRSAPRWSPRRASPKPPSAPGSSWRSPCTSWSGARLATCVSCRRSCTSSRSARSPRRVLVAIASTARRGRRRRSRAAASSRASSAHCTTWCSMSGT